MAAKGQSRPGGATLPQTSAISETPQGSETGDETLPAEIKPTDQAVMASDGDGGGLRRAVEQLLESRLKFEQMLSALSNAFINLPADQIDGQIHTGLRQVAEGLDLDQIIITLTDADNKARTISHSWARDGVPPAPQGKINEIFPWLANRTTKGEICRVSAREDLPEEAVAEREYMQSVGLKSWLTIPLMVGGKQLGGMGTSVFRRQQVWDARLVSRFQQAGEVFANAIARKRTSQALCESQERMQVALDSANLGLWGWVADGNEIWTSGRTLELFAWPPDSKWDYARFLNSIHPEDRESVSRLVKQAMWEPAEYRTEFRILLPSGVRWIKSLGRSYAGAEGHLERIMGGSLDITERKRHEVALAEQLAFRTLLAELSATFISFRTHEVDSKIESGLFALAEALGTDRATLEQKDPLTGDLIVTHSWARPGFPKVPPTIAKKMFPWSVDMINRGEIVFYGSPEELPTEAFAERECLLSLGVKSALIVPLHSAGQVIGALATDTFQELRDWDPETISGFVLAGTVFTRALAQKQSDEELHKAHSEIKELKERLELENLYLREEIELEHHHHEVVGGSEAIRSVLKKAEQVAGTDSTALLLGETGTGKELIARTIHEHSRRKDRPMVKVNCATLPASLVESELFGREKGAYTGALAREIGRFELANGTTIFLDEIGELPLELQAKLLRVLQEGEFERLGSPKTIRVDVRVIAATSRDLRAEVKEGKFREDLFYRLNVFPIQIPPLRERREDIPPLVWHFVRELGRRMGRSVESIRSTTMKAFQIYSWPGNVRELRNEIERHMILNPGPVFHAELPAMEAGGISEGRTLEQIERGHILRVLETTAWRIRGKGGAADILGLKPTTLESRMKKMGIARHA